MTACSSVPHTFGQYSSEHHDCVVAFSKSVKKWIILPDRLSSGDLVVRIKFPDMPTMQRS